MTELREGRNPYVEGGHGEHGPTTIETFTGLTVDLAKPVPRYVRLQDIAHGLANTCRFGGQCKDYYSVAEHAVLVHDLVIYMGGERAEVIGGLLHDAEGAYLGDIPSPLKPLLGEGFQTLAYRWQSVIAYCAGIKRDDMVSRAVKYCDEWALYIEARRLMVSSGWDWTRMADRAKFPARPPEITWHGGLRPKQAKRLFLARCGYTETSHMDEVACSVPST